MLAGAQGSAVAMAMRIVAGTARMLGAERLIPVTSTHIDGCLYHGDSGTLFVERLVAEGGKVAVPSSLNVGSLDLLHGGLVRLPDHQASMARRMMASYAALGCRQTWTCAPYQAGHRPSAGDDVAWGESNAVVFCNSVLGARTNRYGDYLDICAALTARAPMSGLHVLGNRRATLHVDASGLSPRLLAEETFYPVLGAWLGRNAGERVAVISGVPRSVSEDRLKALGAAAASSGSVGLFHIVGRTPEAPDLQSACQGQSPDHTVRLTSALLDVARRTLSTGEVAPGDRLDGVALGSPHFSYEEFEALAALLAGRRCRIPMYVCTGRHVIKRLEDTSMLSILREAGATIVADTCIVVTPILPATAGLIMTNSGKFAHYTKPNTGWDVLFGSLADCVESAVTGRICRDETLWC